MKFRSVLLLTMAIALFVSCNSREGENPSVSSSPEKTVVPRIARDTLVDFGTEDMNVYIGGKKVNLFTPFDDTLAQLGPPTSLGPGVGMDDLGDKFIAQYGWVEFFFYRPTDARYFQNKDKAYKDSVYAKIHQTIRDGMVASITVKSAGYPIEGGAEVGSPKGDIFRIYQGGVEIPKSNEYDFLLMSEDRLGGVGFIFTFVDDKVSKIEIAGRFFFN